MLDIRFVRENPEIVKENTLNEANLHRQALVSSRHLS